MMSKPRARIQVLPEVLRNRIAAGEVVQRPASVVKELVENSLDAGASQVRISVSGGGMDAITVADDGAGIAADDLTLAVRSHATSKVSKTDDLDTIATLGFRGEALASIVSVARVRVYSRPARADVGAEIRIEGGRVGKQRAKGGPAGTVVEVRNLFYNTPARRKHVKTARTEMAHINSTARELALAHPEVSFYMHRDGERVFFTGGSGDLYRCLVELFGADVGEEMLPISGGDEAISGYVATPVLSRARRDRQFLFLNGRPIEHHGMRAVIERAYSGFLQSRRYPFFVVNLSLPYGEIDPNVHPAKREVRLVREREILGRLYNRVRDALLTMPTPRWTVSTGEKPAAGGDEGTREYVREAEPGDRQIRYMPGETGLEDGDDGRRSVYANLEPLGQVSETYIVARGPGGLYLVDQHAACERLYYERALEAASTGQSYSQSLAVPRTLQIEEDGLEAWHNMKDALKDMGYELEEFGHNTLIVRAVPVFLHEPASAQLVSEVLEELAQVGVKHCTLETLATATASCKLAVKAGDRLSRTEAAHLFAEMAGLEQPDTCPHGRPTVVLISERQISAMFKRR